MEKKRKSHPRKEKRKYILKIITIIISTVRIELVERMLGATQVSLLYLRIYTYIGSESRLKDDALQPTTCSNFIHPFSLFIYFLFRHFFPPLLPPQIHLG